MAGSKRRPVFFNLMQIQMPVGALTSIRLLHGVHRQKPHRVDAKLIEWA